MSGHEALLADIGKYCQRHRMAESTFGRLAVNDGKLVARLRDGKSVTLNTLERLQDFMNRDGSRDSGNAGAEETVLGPNGAMVPKETLAAQGSLTAARARTSASSTIARNT